MHWGKNVFQVFKGSKTKFQALEIQFIHFLNSNFTFQISNFRNFWIDKTIVTSITPLLFAVHFTSWNTSPYVTVVISTFTRKQNKQDNDVLNSQQSPIRCDRAVFGFFFYHTSIFG